MKTTKKEIFLKAHALARQIRRNFSSYRKAFGQALKMTYTDLRSGLNKEFAIGAANCRGDHRRHRGAQKFIAPVKKEAVKRFHKMIRMIGQPVTPVRKGFLFDYIEGC